MHKQNDTIFHFIRKSRFMLSLCPSVLMPVLLINFELIDKSFVGFGVDVTQLEEMSHP